MFLISLKRGYIVIGKYCIKFASLTVLAGVAMVCYAQVDSTGKSAVETTFKLRQRADPSVSGEPTIAAFLSKYAGRSIYLGSQASQAQWGGYRVEIDQDGTKAYFKLEYRNNHRPMRTDTLCVLTPVNNYCGSDRLAVSIDATKITMRTREGNYNTHDGPVSPGCDGHMEERYATRDALDAGVSVFSQPIFVGGAVWRQC